MKLFVTTTALTLCYIAAIAIYICYFAAKPSVLRPLTAETSSAAFPTGHTLIPMQNTLVL